MINSVSRDSLVKRTFRMGLMLCLVSLLLYTSGCAMSRSVTMSNLDDTIEHFACRVAEGAKRSGAEIEEATLAITAATVYDAEAGITIPVAMPITAKGKAKMTEGTTITLKLDLANVDCGKEPRAIRAYKVNPSTLKIQKQLYDN